MEQAGFFLETGLDMAFDSPAVWKIVLFEDSVLDLLGKGPCHRGKQSRIPQAAIEVTNQPRSFGEEQGSIKLCRKNRGHFDGSNIIAAMTLDQGIPALKEGFQPGWNPVAGMFTGNQKFPLLRGHSNTCQDEFTPSSSKAKRLPVIEALTQLLINSHNPGVRKISLESIEDAPCQASLMKDQAQGIHSLGRKQPLIR